MPSPSPVPAKRPTDTPTGHRSKHLKMEDSQPNTAPSLAPTKPPIIHSQRPLVTSSRVTAPDSPTQPSAREAQYMMDDQPEWSGKLIWSCGGSEVYAVVQATNSIHDPGPSNWPTTLRLEIIEAGLSTLDIQARVQRNKAPVARVQCPPGTNNHHFGELVTTLRKGKCVAIALLESDTQDKGSPKSSLVLAPLFEGLLCATFPASDLPKAELQQPQPYRNGQLQQPQAQQDEHHPSQDAQLVLVDALLPCGSEPIITAENGARSGFDPTRPHTDQWDVSSDLYGGAMEGIRMEMMRDVTCGVTQDAQDIVFQSIIHEYH